MLLIFFILGQCAYYYEFIKHWWPLPMWNFQTTTSYKHGLLQPTITSSTFLQAQSRLKYLCNRVAPPKTTKMLLCLCNKRLYTSQWHIKLTTNDGFNSVPLLVAKEVNSAVYIHANSINSPHRKEGRAHNPTVLAVDCSSRHNHTRSSKAGFRLNKRWHNSQLCDWIMINLTCTTKTS